MKLELAILVGALKDTKAGILSGVATDRKLLEGPAKKGTPGLVWQVSGREKEILPFGQVWDSIGFLEVFECLDLLLALFG